MSVQPHRSRHLACLAFFALFSAAALRAQPVLAGFSTRVGLDAEGAWIYLFVDGSAGPRSVLISAAGPGYAGQVSARTVSDPQLEIFDPSGNRLFFNDDRADSLLGDASLPAYARTAKDAALRVSLATGAYVVRVSGVAGATGIVGLDVIDSSTRPGLASFALRARGGDLTPTPVQLRYVGGGNINLGLFLTGPNLPVTNPMEDPRLVLSTFSVRGNIDGSFTATSDPFVQTLDTLNAPAAAAARFRSPVYGDGRNAAHMPLMSLPPSMPITVSVQNQTAATNGMFLLEVHNLDNTTLRPPVVYVPPQSISVPLGGSGTLRAIVGGDQSTIVRFEKDGVDLGANSAALLFLLGSGPGIAGNYRVRATSSAGTAVSAVAAVTVPVPPPVVQTFTGANMVFAGEPIGITVSVTGTGLTYQWRKDGVPIPGATTATLSIPVTQPSDAGSYTLQITNSGGTVVSPVIPIYVYPADPGRLTNLSVRAFSGVGDRVLIVGFTLSGPSPKPLVIRGIGPALAAFGVSSFIPDPRLGLFVDTSELASNNDWTGNDGRGLGAFALTAGSRDSVIAMNLGARSYSAQVTGAGTTGDALVEVYDGDTADATVRLVNLSTRTQLGDGDRLIVGLTITGRTSPRILIRAVGPTLGAFGVSTAHPDPRLELYRGSTLITQNDDWQGDDGRGSGAFPLVAGSKDAALIAPLGAAGYSVHVLGARGASGITLVEVYELP